MSYNIKRHIYTCVFFRWLCTTLKLKHGSHAGILCVFAWVCCLCIRATRTKKIQRGVCMCMCACVCSFLHVTLCAWERVTLHCVHVRVTRSMCVGVCVCVYVRVCVYLHMYVCVWFDARQPRDTPTMQHHRTIPSIYPIVGGRLLYKLLSKIVVKVSLSI